jgi:hypothetical protein
MKPHRKILTGNIVGETDDFILFVCNKNCPVYKILGENEILKFPKDKVRIAQHKDCIWLEVPPRLYNQQVNMELRIYERTHQEKENLTQNDNDYLKETSNKNQQNWGDAFLENGEMLNQ